MTCGWGLTRLAGCAANFTGCPVVSATTDTIRDRGDVITVRGERYVPLTLDQPEEQKRMFRLASRPCLIPSDIEPWRVLKPLPKS